MKRSTRYIILAIMAAVTVGCALLFPKININGDMTQYLPSDSRMRDGLDSLKSNFPEIDLNAYYVKVMLRNTQPSDTLANGLCSVEGVGGITAVSTGNGHTLYQLSVTDGADPKGIAETIRTQYGDCVVVETNANSNMPDNMVLVLVIAVVLVFGILFLMCSSFVEALLFIVTIGMAVVINMGTNALLPSVSMMTNTIVAVLQLVLSMDYSIILMNRFRQVLSTEPDIDKAMSSALKKASASILSSSLTTIVGLLALVFMKFKIGLDLGSVLAKGVLCSLIATYTILPALILIFYKGIKATEKRVPLIPTDGIARFEMKFRVPLAILFLAVFIASSILSERTELSYASIWESEIADEFPPQNLFSLLYRTSDEDSLIDGLDTISSDSKVVTALSYPSIFKKGHSVDGMLVTIDSLLALLPVPKESLPDLGMLNANTLKILYYGASHPVRDEKISFQDMLELAGEAEKSGLIPEGFDLNGLIAKYDESGSVKVADPVEDSVENSVEEFVKEPQEKSETKAVASALPDSATAASPVEPTADVEAETDPEGETTVNEAVTDDFKTLLPGKDQLRGDKEVIEGKYSFTKENCTLQMSPDKLADFLGFSRKQASTIYSMAGRKKSTMSPYEFIHYMTGTVLQNKFLRKMIRKDQAEGLKFIEAEMDSVMNAPEIALTETPVETPETESVAIDTVIAAPDIAAPVIVSPATDIAEAPVATTVEQRDEATGEETFLDEMTELFISGKKLTMNEMQSAFAKSGIKEISPEMVELMFLYWGSLHNYDSKTALSIEEVLEFLTTEVIENEAYSAFLDDSSKAMLSKVDQMVSESLGALRKDNWSMAAIVTDYSLESEETFNFIDKVAQQCTSTLGDDYRLIGESVMYKEMKEGFRKELLLLTLLTVISIFVIVALTFKSLLIPLILVMTVMTGVYVNVIVSGLGGKTMLYLAYLIVQSILMGATIDYGILFTNYYREKRAAGLETGEALKEAYRGSIHTIMTSGLIIICAPYIMSLLLPDPAISAILSSLTFGALAAIILILFVLPATLAVCDRFVSSKRR